MEVTFKFVINEEILTPFDEKGIVTWCAATGMGNQCYVELAEGKATWFDEDLLRSATEAA